MKCCRNCENWISATAECAIMLKALANGWEVSREMNNALAADCDVENDCNEYK
jgi:hypothetical protein